MIAFIFQQDMAWHIRIAIVGTGARYKLVHTSSHVYDEHEWFENKFAWLKNHIHNRVLYVKSKNNIRHPNCDNDND